MNRRGFALLLALAALACLGAVAATGVALAIREAASGRSARNELWARSAAETALAESFRGWERVITPRSRGDSAPLAAVFFPGLSRGSAVLRSLGGAILAIEATGEALGPAGAVMTRSRVELLVRLDSAGPDSLIRPRPIRRGWRQIP